jgi:hypothetical protein
MPEQAAGRTAVLAEHDEPSDVAERQPDRWRGVDEPQRVQHGLVVVA